MQNTIIKTGVNFGLASLTLAVLLISSCTSFSENKIADNEDTELVKRDVDNLQKEYNEAYNTLKYKSDSTFIKNDLAISLLKLDVQSMSVKEGERTKDQLAILGEKNQLLKKQIEDYQTDDYNKWETFKNHFDDDMIQLEKEIKNLTEVCYK